LPPRGSRGRSCGRWDSRAAARPSLRLKQRLS
jgi:hypothetical protein